MAGGQSQGHNPSAHPSDPFPTSTRYLADTRKETRRRQSPYRAARVSKLDVPFIASPG